MPKHGPCLQWPRKGVPIPNNAVTLRHTEPNDYPELEIWWNDHAIADDCRHTMEKVPDKTIDQMFHTWSDEDDDRRFGRTTLGPDGHPVGHIIAKDCTAPDHNATMTILIGPYYQNHGYGSLAMKLGIKLAAEQLGAKTITLKVWSFNLRARHMYESLGFKETGRAEHAVERDGHWFDEVVYEAPVSMLLERIAAEESARAEGEKLEEQRLEAKRQSDRIAQR